MSVLAVRLLVLFEVPLLAQTWIAIRYFDGLQVYEEHQIDGGRDVLLRERLFGFDLAHWWNKSVEIPKKVRFAVVNGDLADVCRYKWAHPREKPDEKASRCVLDEFPRFVLPLNSWINLLSLLATAFLSGFGAHAYVVPPPR